MNGYLITVPGNAEQNDLLQKLKTDGWEVIQTASGLCVKSDLPQNDVEGKIGKPVRAVDLTAKDLSADIQAFLR